jgi:hypothetical protein
MCYGSYVVCILRIKNVVCGVVRSAQLDIGRDLARLLILFELPLDQFQHVHVV